MTLHRNSRAKAIRGAAGVGVLALSATLLSGMTPASAQQYPPNPGGSGQAPGQGGNNPGQGGNNPGQGGNNPGQSGNNPGQSGNNPGQGGNNPGQSGNNPGQGAKPPKPNQHKDATPRTVRTGTRTVITGTATPGSTVSLVGRQAGGQFRPIIGAALGSAGSRVVAKVVVGADGIYTFHIVPSANTRYRVDVAQNGQTTEGDEQIVNVTPEVVQKVVRAGRARTYVFSGYIEPSVAGIPVTILRNGANGGSVVVARGLTDATGAYRITRTFVGRGGTFLFFTRSDATQNAIAGTSSVRSISIR